MTMGTVTAVKTGLKTSRVYVRLKNKSVWAAPEYVTLDSLKVQLAASKMQVQLKDWTKVR